MGITYCGCFQKEWQTLSMCKSQESECCYGAGPLSLTITDHVLERVAGKSAYSFLDGFSGYNQVSIKEEDQHKTAFATKWGIYAYRVMPFGLTNAPATFQRLMTHAFKEYLRIFLEIFMDDLCIHTLI